MGDVFGGLPLTRILAEREDSRDAGPKGFAMASLQWSLSARARTRRM